MLIRYTDGKWSINGEPAKEEDVWPILTENYQEKKAIDQLTRTGVVRIEI